MRMILIVQLILFLFTAAPAGCRGIDYTNPIIYADISDPDVVGVDGNYWMTASSFNCRPGLLIYHSTDLVHWNIVNSALPEGISYQGQHDKTQHGNGVWAPSIRYHDGLYWIFWGDPDYGIYQVHAKDPMGRWSEPHCIIQAKGMIDPCPLWDDDGRVYLVHAWAKSRCGFKSILSVCELDKDCTRCISEQTLVFDGNTNGNETVEGPKFYKRDGEYIILAPAGGVKTGWQLVMKADNPYGPYDWKVAMHQGESETFGPHQGAWVKDSCGEDWFLHFEDRYAYGRVLHLQPMQWQKDGFCIIGLDSDGDGIGEPVKSHKIPAASQKRVLPQNDAYLYQYQGQSAEGEWPCLWDNPNLKLCKIEGPQMTLEENFDSGKGGLVVLGENYSAIECVRDADRLVIRRRSCENARKSGEEHLHDIITIAATASCKLRVRIEERKNTPEAIFPVRDTYVALCFFEYDCGDGFKPLGQPFIASAGRWVGARAGKY